VKCLSAERVLIGECIFVSWWCICQFVYTQLHNIQKQCNNKTDVN